MRQGASETYCNKIAKAILAQPDQRATARKLFQLVTAKQGSEVSSKSKQNQIRNTLWKNECFVKDTIESGNRHYWRVHPIAAIMLERSNFSTRPLKVNSAVRLYEERAAQRAHRAAKHRFPARVDDYQTGQMPPLLSKPVSDTQWSTYNSEQDFDDDIDAGVHDTSLLDAVVSELEQRSGPAGTYANDQQAAQENLYSSPYARAHAQPSANDVLVLPGLDPSPLPYLT